MDDREGKSDPTAELFSKLRDAARRAGEGFADEREMILSIRKFAKDCLSDEPETSVRAYRGYIWGVTALIPDEFWEEIGGTGPLCPPPAPVRQIWGIE